jgi:hypothetical protein
MSPFISWEVHFAVEYRVMLMRRATGEPSFLGPYGLFAPVYLGAYFDKLRTFLQQVVVTAKAI